MRAFLFIFSFLLLASIAFANGEVDSLRAVAYDETLHDTLRLKALWKFGVKKELSEKEALEAFAIGEKLAKAQPNYRWLCDNFRQRGTLYYFRGQLPKSVVQIKSALKIAEENNDDRMRASLLKNLGILYRRLDNYVEATEAMLTSEKLYIKLGDSAQLAGTYNNLGNLYDNRGEYETAEKYFLLSVEINQNNPDALATNYLNLGNLASSRKELEKAMMYYRKSQQKRNLIKSSRSSSILLHNIGSLYNEMQKYDSALIFLDSAYRMRLVEKNNYGLTSSMIALSEVQLALKHYELAIEYGSEALALSQANSDLSRAKEACELMEKSCAGLGKFEQAYDWAQLRAAYKDSIFDSEKIQASTRIDMQHSFEKILLADSLKTAKDKEIAAAELASANSQKYALWGGMGGVLILVAVVYRGYRRKKSDNELITEQKELVEEKNKEIVDSINYAKRLQDAILPPKKFVAEHLPNSFILFLPKDIVAGDFYWMEVLNDTIYIAAADCTGHGVPGAMVSVVCSNALNKAVLEMKLADPGEILDKTRELVTQHFDKGESEVKDGMDISFCAIDKAGKRMKWAGAYNPLWLIRNGELIEHKADKQAIGKVDSPSPFTTHEIELQENDTFYVFTDGFADQFGGDKGKKLKSANLKKLLLDLQGQNMQQQEKSLNHSFADWKGDLEQLDDVCVIGVRV